MNRIEAQQKVLGENDRLAKSLRDRLRENGMYCLNLISSRVREKPYYWSGHWQCSLPTQAQQY